MASFFQRMLFALLATSTFISQSLGTSLQKRADNVIAPLSITPDQNWDGIDGKWSSFTLRVGTPQQFVRTFVSWAIYQTWVVLPQGCAAAQDQKACADARGWLFHNETSSTYEYVGVYKLWIGANLRPTGNAAVGFDRVGLSGVGENGPTLDDTTVAAFATQNMYYVGMFGINPKPTNFTNFNEPTPSYMTRLKEQNMIPSISFGYTAGAHYQFTGTFASLTLGGYDTSKYIANNLTFVFAPDNERDVMVAIQSISTSARIASSPVGTELVRNKFYALIDSSSAELWLPEEVCEAFELEFGLIYDSASDLYLVNDTLHEALLERNASVTFKLGQSPDSQETVKITLPYAAFDQKATPPYQNVAAASNYFPLRRVDAAEATLGRVFMQEAYVTVDYEVSRFQVAQVAWDQTAEKNLVAIPPANASTDDSLWTSPNWSPKSPTDSPTGTNRVTSTGASSDSESSSLGAGAIAGIAVGAAAVVGLIGAFVFFYLRRQKRKKAAAAAAVAAAAAAPSEKPTSSQGSTTSQVKGATVYPKAELAGSGPYPFGMTHHELDLKGLLPPGTANNGSVSATSPMSLAGEGTFSSGNTLMSPASEADSRPVEIYEMPGDMPLVREKDGKQLSEKEALQHREKLYNGVDSTVTTPTTAGGADATVGGAQGPVSHTPPRRVNPGDIVNAHTGQSVSGHHRAFSFEGERGTHDSR